MEISAARRLISNKLRDQSYLASLLPPSGWEGEPWRGMARWAACFRAEADEDRSTFSFLNDLEFNYFLMYER